MAAAHQSGEGFDGPVEGPQSAACSLVWRPFEVFGIGFARVLQSFLDDCGVIHAKQLESVDSAAGC